MNQPLPHVSNRSLFARLQREWAAITHRPAVLTRVQQWGVGVGFHSLDDVVAATGFCVRKGDRIALADLEGDDTDLAAAHAANEVLAHLLLAARADDVAARVVLQRMMPGLIGTAGRWTATRPGGSVDAFDELLSVAWTVIREFPVERRPHHLAANLLRDSEYRAFGRSARRMIVHELTPDGCDEMPAAEAVIDPCDELAELVACARMLSADDLRLIGMLARGCSQAEVAAALDVSVRTVRNHRDAVLHRLRAAALAA